MELSRKAEAIKKELEIRLIEETKRASMRAGIKWVENGEKGNNFFLGLETCRAKSNTTFRLKRNNTEHITSSSEEILKEICVFYERLYQENTVNIDGVGRKPAKSL